MNQQANPVEVYAIIELFGHTRMAGKVSEFNLGGNFIRIDVPPTSTQGGYSRFVNPSAVYAINPVTEEVALAMAERLQTKPIESWDIAEMQKRLLALKKPANESHNDEFSSEFY